jgi:membrane protease YdiL (CAAX protease family)
MRLFVSFLSMILPTVIVYFFLISLKNAWVAIAAFHLIPCTLIPVVYITFFHGKEVDKDSIKGFQLVAREDDHNINIPEETHLEVEDIAGGNMMMDLDLMVDGDEDETKEENIRGLGLFKTIRKKIQWNIRKRRFQSQTRRGFWTSLMPDEGKRLRTIEFACLVYTLTLFIGVLLYVFLRQYMPNVTATAADYQLERRTVTLVAFMFYFAIINSLVEEFFWRAFLSIVFGSYWFPHRVIETLAYMAYHVLVLSIFFPWYLVAIFSIGVYIAGVVFVILYDTFGFIVAYGAHAGGDTVIMIILANMYYGSG